MGDTERLTLPRVTTEKKNVGENLFLAHVLKAKAIMVYLTLLFVSFQVNVTAK